MKSKALSKAAKIRSARARTGGLPNNEPALNEQDIQICSLFGSNYWEGSSCADLYPEEIELIERLEQGDEGVFREEPVCTRVAEALNIPKLPIVSSREYGEENRENPETGASIGEEMEVAGPSWATPRRPLIPKRQLAKENTPQPKRIRRERIGVQLAEARSNFERLCAGQNDSMKVFAEAMRENAKANLINAKANEQRAVNERRRLILEETRSETDRLRVISEKNQADNEMRRLDLEERCERVLQRATGILERFEELLQNNL